MEKLPSIKELKIICQPDPKKETVWYAKIFIRKISIYITWILLHTPLTANQATVIQGLLGIAGSIILAFSGRGFWAILALLIIQLSYTFDCVDGEIARFRKKPTVNGIFFDSLNHALVIPAIFLGLAIYAHNITNQTEILIAGAILALIAANPVKKGMLSAVFHLLERKNDPKYKYENLAQNVELNEVQTANTNMKNGYYIGQKTFRQQILNWAKAASEYPASMNIITLVIIADFLIAKYTTWQIYPLPAILTLAYLIFLLGKEGFFFHKLANKNRIEKKFLEIIK